MRDSSPESSCGIRAAYYHGAVFTGLIEAVGRVAAATRRKSGLRLAVVLPWPVTEGESVAVNGVCLTVAGPTGAATAFDVVPETLAKTTLGRLKRGSPVNLERPLKAGDRLGGHIVQGHVDGTGVVRSPVRSRKGTVLTVKVDPSLARPMIAKGSVAVDGVSLTLVDVGEDFFTVALIPVTLRDTTLGKAGKGTTVNVEVDVVAKQVEKLAGKKKGGLTKELLRKAGFLNSEF